MPIIGDEHGILSARLAQDGVDVIEREAAEHQDIRPLRIGLLNLMPQPAMEAAEVQWLRHLGETVLQIDPVLIKFDDDWRERPGASRQSILGRYVPFSAVAEQGLDGLVITGDNLEVRTTADDVRELFDFADIAYGAQLREVIEWANSSVYSTIYSCLASHFALHQLFGLPRNLSEQKVLGVYDHEITNPNSVFTHNMGSVIRSPHSRWGDTPTEEVEKAELKLLAASEAVGWLLLEVPNAAGGADLYIQGHPEYDRDDLDQEWQRDRAYGQAPPVGYYEEDDPEKPVRFDWVSDARALHSNWRALVNRMVSEPQEVAERSASE